MKRGKTKTILENICNYIKSKYKAHEVLSEYDKNWLLNNIFKYHPTNTYRNYLNDDRHVENITTGTCENGKECFYIMFSKDKNGCIMPSQKVSFRKSILAMTQQQVWDTEYYDTTAGMGLTSAE